MEFEFSKKRKHSLIADTKLKIDQIKRKIEANLNKPLFDQKAIIFKNQNDHKLSGNQLDIIFWR